MKHLLPCLLASLHLLGTACSSPEKPTAAPPTTPADTTAAPAAAATPAQNSFSWDDETCHHTGYFAPGQYAEPQLRATYKLVNYPGITVNESVWKLAEMQPDTIAGRLRRLDAEYEHRRAELRALRVLPQAYWQRLQQLRQQELEEDYQLRRLTLRAYLSPELLLGAAPACQEYAQALASPDTALLFRAWHALVQEQKKNNGAPAALEVRYQQQYHAPEREQYARLELLSFGWWNCALQNKKYDAVYDQQRPALVFQRLFTRVEQTDCEGYD